MVVIFVLFGPTAWVQIELRLICRLRLRLRTRLRLSKLQLRLRRRLSGPGSGGCAARPGGRAGRSASGALAGQVRVLAG